MSKCQVLTIWQATRVLHLIDVDVAGNLVDHFCALESPNFALEQRRQFLI